MYWKRRPPGVSTEIRSPVTRTAIPDFTGYTRLPGQAEMSIPLWNENAPSSGPVKHGARVAEAAAHGVHAMERLHRPRVGGEPVAGEVAAAVLQRLPDGQARQRDRRGRRRGQRHTQQPESRETRSLCDPLPSHRQG